ncbi:hypothetical protein KCP77_16145 [Salmonella enterica subsp. enterica]|nr:hypothetical protein KCP77_16145 [Salmonella enterica subsp. enterica]
MPVASGRRRPFCLQAASARRYPHVRQDHPHDAPPASSARRTPWQNDQARAISSSLTFNVLAQNAPRRRRR